MASPPRGYNDVGERLLADVESARRRFEADPRSIEEYRLFSISSPSTFPMAGYRSTLDIVDGRSIRLCFPISFSAISTTYGRHCRGRW